MEGDLIPGLIEQVSQQRMCDDLFYLASDPLPFRKLNFTLPGHAKCTLYEADDFVRQRLESLGYTVAQEGCPVQAFRPEPIHLPADWSLPMYEDDCWYTAYNLYASRPGTSHADEIVLVVSHKDSQSWVDSPGAYDNAVGTVASLEIARILAGSSLARTVRFLYCNEEHWPWTSVIAAKRARHRGDNIVAVLNLDGLSGKSQADIDAGHKTNVTRYFSEEGKRLADMMAGLNDRYGIGLSQGSYCSPAAMDDDGSFYREGFSSSILNIGSMPYVDPCYHQAGDVPGRVDLENLTLAARLSLAAVVTLAERLEGPYFSAEGEQV